uniref:Serine/threonine protein kinase n=1 Tax=Schlesneria paludicola TaxID=360056 RepID=A0A7C2NY50_9PLAN
MLEPPTPELQQRLAGWRLCRPADLRRARRRVRQLARDLPAFDSVWIDALVQDGRLTPFQARVLESDEPESLAVGDYVLLDELGRSRGSRTWLARSLSQGTPCVVKRVTPPPERKSDLAARGRRLAALGVGNRIADLVAPTAFWEDDRSCFFVMPFVAGTPLGELLVRRGRFPADIVAEIGRQIAAALDNWHRDGQVHGDIRLSHVRITPRGEAVLVETGLRPVIEPDVTLHTSLSLEAYDGIAPELIGIGHEPTPESDLYALGCLLWQLLAGRPPFTTADPLAKLAAHQTRSIADVREWAPETPAALAELIVSLTHCDPQQRPSSAGDVAQRLQRLGTPGRSAVRAFRRRFDVSVPHLRPPTTAGLPRWLTAAVVLFAVSGLIASLVDRELRTELLSLTGWTPQPVARPTVPRIDATSGLLPLPGPSADGLLLLNEPGPYAVASIRHAGRLQIKGVAGVCPVILVRDEPLEIAAESVAFEHVTLRQDVLWPGPQRPAALAVVQAQQVTATACEFDTGLVHRNRRASEIPAGLFWTLIDPLDPAAGALALQGVLFRGAGTGVASNAAARRIVAEDVLWHGQGIGFDLRLPEDAPTTLRLEHVTAREPKSLLRLRGLSGEASSPRLTVTAIDSVFGVTRSLLQIDDAEPMLGPLSLDWNGEGSLLPPDMPIAVANGADVATEGVPIEGLAAGRFAFVGPSTESIADSVLAEAEAPRRSSEPPGLRADRFGPCRGEFTPRTVPDALPEGTFNRIP